jgi:hypothetical protein
MSGFISGLAVGIAVAWWVKYRADAEAVMAFIAIYNGDAMPDEAGNIGWVIK